MTRLELALEYQSDGWAVFPVSIDKKPLLPAGEQKKRLWEAASEEEVIAMWKKYPDANIGLGCGKVSGRTVVDIDKGMDIFPDTRTIRTPSGGFHKIYQYESSVNTSAGTYFEGIDIRNDGGYIVAAGSYCEYEKDGKRIKGDYVVVEETPSRPFPTSLFDRKAYKTEHFDPKKLMGAGEGTRNNDAASVVGMLVQGKSKEMQVPLWELTKAWNKGNKPPMDEKELLQVFNSITNKEWSKQQKNIQEIDKLKLWEEGRSTYIEVPVSEGIVEFRFSEIERSRQSFEAVLHIQLTHTKEGKLPPFEQRIDMNSSSAISNLATALNSAYGNKKEGYNWTLILNRVGSVVKKHINQVRKPVKFTRDDKYKHSVYLIENFLEVGSATLLHGDGSTGKSYASLYMAACAATGRDFLGKKTTYFKTLYLDHESTQDKLLNRMWRVANGMGVDFDMLAGSIEWYKPESSLSNERENIARMVEEGGFGCIIVDAGASASGGSPMDEQAVLKLFSALDHIPCAKIIIHHEPKHLEGTGDDKAYYGTTFWRNAPRLAWRLKREEKTNGKSVIKATQHKANDDGESMPITYTMEFPLGDFEPKVIFEVTDDFELSDDERIINYIIEGEADMEGIQKAVGLSRQTVQRRVEALLLAHKIERKRAGKKYVFFVA